MHFKALPLNIYFGLSIYPSATVMFLHVNLATLKITLIPITLAYFVSIYIIKERELSHFMSLLGSTLKCRAVTNFHLFFYLGVNIVKEPIYNRSKGTTPQEHLDRDTTLNSPPRVLRDMESLELKLKILNPTRSPHHSRFSLTR